MDGELDGEDHKNMIMMHTRHNFFLLLLNESNINKTIVKKRFIVILCILSNIYCPYGIAN